MRLLSPGNAQAIGALFDIGPHLAQVGRDRSNTIRFFHAQFFAVAYVKAILGVGSNGREHGDLVNEGGGVSAGDRPALPGCAAGFNRSHQFAMMLLNRPYRNLESHLHEDVEKSWLDLTFVVQPGSDPDNRRAMSNIRGRAQLEFAMNMMSEALREYGQSHGGQFPAAVADLAPYFKTPVDDAVLQDWIILPTSRLSAGLQVDDEWVITQKGPVDANLDQRLVVGLRQMRIGTGGSSDWVEVPQ